LETNQTATSQSISK